MKMLSDIDPNFKIDTNISEPDITFYNVKEYPDFLHGITFDTIFRRMPEEVAKNVNFQVNELHTNTSGGRIRFVTDSPYVAIAAKMPVGTASPHMPLTGKAGFDMYVDGEFRKMFVPPVDSPEGYTGIGRFPDAKLRQITINFPLYNDVHDLYIGLKDGSVFEQAPKYKSDKKVVFYGSSITQGGCASRPGLSYAAILSSSLGFDFVNLGFSSGAFGEEIMAKYIAGLGADIFVMDYDHNAPSSEFLKSTHENFFKLFRSLQPSTPVIMMTGPNILFGDSDWPVRREVIRTTYENAVKNGDKNVYFIDGEALWGEDWNMCTVDCLHPNDAGFIGMAKEVSKVLKDLV